MEDSEEFRGLTPAEKLYLWYILSEYGRRGEFYMADLEAACTIGVKVGKVREARRKLTGLGWLEVKPGFKTQGKNLSSRYLNVKWATVEPGDFFACTHRYGFETMINKIVYKVFTHPDVVTYVYLCYLWWKNRGAKGGEFFVTKAALRDMTNIQNVTTCVENLHNKFSFNGGARLFKFQDLYHKLKFTDWGTFADPSEDESNRKISEERKKKVKDLVAAAKKIEDLKNSTIEPGDLPRFYQGLYATKFGAGYRLGASQVEKLITLSEKHGVGFMKAYIYGFMNSSAHTKTCQEFLKWFAGKCPTVGDPG